MSASHTPCAACKCRRQKCTLECVFAPYFPQDNPQKFINVHKIFGASNVAKLLNELNPNQREEAVNSLAYEAEYRLKDPVYGCVGLVSILQHKLRQIQHDLECAKKELSTYIGPSSMLPILNHPGLLQQQQQQQNFGHSVHQMMPYHVQQMMFPMGAPQQQQQQQILEAQQLIREQEMFRAYAQQQQLQQQQQEQQNDLVKFGDASDDASQDPIAATDFNQMPVVAAAPMQPSLALSGSYESDPSHHIQQRVHVQEHSHFQSHPYSNPSHQLQLHQQQSLIQQQLASHSQQQLASHSQQQTLTAADTER